MIVGKIREFENSDYYGYSGAIGYESLTEEAKELVDSGYIDFHNPLITEFEDEDNEENGGDIILSYVTFDPEETSICIQAHLMGSDDTSRFFTRYLYDWQEGEHVYEKIVRELEAKGWNSLGSWFESKGLKFQPY